MAGVEDTENLFMEEDYYALFNLSKEATSEEITNSYRRLGKLYHPDKHTDPLLKKNAEIMFNKIKTAYKVLSDPHDRAVYDTLGTKGLDTTGWQIIERTKTPREIREEYELLLKAKEAQLLQNRTNPKGTVIVGINATDIFESYDFGYSLPNIEISSMHLSQSVEAPISDSDRITMSGSLTTQNGNGQGHVACNLKKAFSSNCWVESVVSVGNGFMYSLKGFRRLTVHALCTAQASFQFRDEKISPGIELMMAQQLSQKTIGYLTWKFGTSSQLTTSISHELKKGALVAEVSLIRHEGYISLSYTKSIVNGVRLKASVKLGVFGFNLQYGCDHKITKHTTAGATMVIGTPGGITLRIRIVRANQSFTFPILLAEEFVPGAVFYGTAAPIVGWFILKSFVFDPYNERQKKKETQKTKEANAEKMAEKRKEASIAVSLMQETYWKMKSKEEKLNGLIIKRALYGSTEKINNLSLDQIESDLEVLDTTVQLQCLVKDSVLVLFDRSKSNLPGFYDPCIGEEKSLHVEYIFRKIPRSTVIKDYENLKIPKREDSI